MRTTRPALKISLEVGDRVGYRVRFLRSVGMVHSEWARLRGTVVRITPVGSMRLVEVDWDAPPEEGWPRKINEQNLAKVGTLPFTSEDY